MSHSIEEKIELAPEQVSRWQRIGLSLGVLAIIAAAILGALRDDGMSRFMHAYLWGFTLILSFALGALFFVLITTLFRAKALVVVRRLAENMTGVFPMLCVLSLPIVISAFANSDVLYIWLNEHAHDDHIIHSKAAWLNGGFFGARLLIYLVLGTAISMKFRKASIQRETSEDPEAISEKLRVLSAPFVIIFALITTFGSFDLLMSLAPKWFSTIFGIYYFAGCFLSALAILSLTAMAIQRGGALTKSVTVEHYHDLGKLLFGFVFFWSYIAFSQYMLIWYANIPEETEWYYHVTHGGWGWVATILLFGHFVFPFLFLLSRNTKRTLKIYTFFCVWMLVMQMVDLYWLIMPHYGQHFVEHSSGTWELMQAHHATYSVVDFACVIGFIGLFVGAFAGQLKGNLLPLKDPRLKASQRFENF